MNVIHIIINYLYTSYPIVWLAYQDYDLSCNQSNCIICYLTKCVNRIVRNKIYTCMLLPL